MCRIAWRSQQPGDEEEAVQSPRQRFLGYGEYKIPEVQSYQEQSRGSWKGQVTES